MAVPAEAWRRKTAKRILPNGALKKAVRVEVPLCADGRSSDCCRRAVSGCMAGAAAGRVGRAHVLGCGGQRPLQLCHCRVWGGQLGLEDRWSYGAAASTALSAPAGGQEASERSCGSEQEEGDSAASFSRVASGIGSWWLRQALKRDLQGGFGRDGRHLASISCSGFVREPRVTFEEEPEM